MKQLLLRLTVAQHQRLWLLAQHQGNSIAALVRIAIEEYLARQEAAR